ncbi:arylesterase [Roseovarius gahaiensis]|uniref:Arylesterase n=1 Tax=Roseovarius gahaiensis TaxID=2716691 RepID=A0A967EKG2_9RHOB|nr:arylesterase [Roseovarius gahaiensis]NHQ74314.1 arylesterase [Roseovarius gahaiensis]
MGLYLITKDFLTYGVTTLRGKVLAALLLVAPPVFAEQVSVLAFGDSLTQGYGLLDHQGLVPQLDQWLEDQGHAVRVVNGGVSGETTAGGAARIEWSLTPDIDTVMVTLGANDMLRGIDPAVSRANLDRILTATQKADVPVLLVGMRAPGNYGAEYQAAYDSIYPDLAQKFDTLYFDHFFAGLGSDDPAQLRDYFQPDGIHPNAEGVQLIVEALGPKVVQLVEAAK